MSAPVPRYSGRVYNALRKVRATFNTFGYAPGSVLFEMGRTKVLCAVGIQHGVPAFLKGKHRGWLTAEYAMLPTSTGVRTQREASTMRKNGRSIEISRFIARCLRTIIDFETLGERTIVVDCDVLQADAGTRTACITGASLALCMAVDRWLADGVISKNILRSSLAAISVGWLDGQPLLDLDFSEDSRVDADFNVVMTDTGNLVEIQGAVEGATLSWDQFEQVRALAVSGIKDLFKECERLAHGVTSRHAGEKTRQHGPRTKRGIFSLGNRQTIST